MIAGEEIWIERLSSKQEYDEFFKKIRKKLKKKVKKVQPFKVFNPIIKKSPLKKLIQTVKSSRPTSPPRPTPSPPVVFQELPAAATRKKSIAQNEEDLLQQIEEHENKKVDDARELEEKEAAIVQSQIDTDYGNNKQMIAIGAIALVCVIGLAGLIVYSKSVNHKNQVNAMQLQMAAAKIPTV